MILLPARDRRTLLWANLHNGYVWVVLVRHRRVTAPIGFDDDYLKVTKRNRKRRPGPHAGC